MKIKTANRVAVALAITAAWTMTSLAQASPPQKCEGNGNDFRSKIKGLFSTNVSHYMIFQEEGVGLKIAANPASGVVKARLGWEQNIIQLVPKVDLKNESENESKDESKSKSKNNASALAASKTIFRSMRPPTVEELIATGDAADNLAKNANGKKSSVT